MTTRERFQAIMNFQPFDRLPLVEWANWWTLTITRWRNEGLPVQADDRYAIVRHFGLDIYKQGKLSPYSPGFPPPPAYGAGVIKNEKDYENLRDFLYPQNAVAGGLWASWAEERQDSVLWFTFDGCFWFPRNLFGIEGHLYAFYDQPELIHRINRDHLDFQRRALDQLCEIVTPDFMTFAEDLSYNHGPMLSRSHFDEHIKPYYKEIIPLIKEYGIIPFVDTDGNVHEIIEWLIDAGVEGVLPLERQAGNDVALLRRRYPKFHFIGAFDKLVMHRGEKAIRNEFARLIPTAIQGGFVIGCDHQTPPSVSYGNYLQYLTLFREYAQKAGGC